MSRQDLRHHVLSELHKLLSVTSASDFLRARDLSKSENIARALEALAEEKQAKTRKTTRETQAVTKPRQPAILVERGRGVPQRVNEHELLELMLKSPRLGTRHEVIRFAQIHGIALRVNDKDSRQRVIRSLLNHILSQRPDHRKRMIRELVEQNGKQTEGWAQVIGG